MWHNLFPLEEIMFVSSLNEENSFNTLNDAAKLGKGMRAIRLLPIRLIKLTICRRKRMRLSRISLRVRLAIFTKR